MPLIARRSLLAGAAAGVLAPRWASAAEPLKAVWVYTGPVADMGYTYEHDLGRLAVQKHFAGAVATSFVENVAEGPDAERVLRQLAGVGNGLIFSTSFGFMNSAGRVARQFPDVRFEQATGYRTASNLAEYNLRFYEGRWVCGIAAGMLSKSGVAGYVAAYQIPEVIMGINAFTLAARTVNPAFRTKVIWINSWVDPAREADAANSLVDQGADILTDHMDSSAVMQTAERHGLLGFGQSADRSTIAPHAQLTAIIDDWAPYYLQRTQAALDGTWKTGSVWLGMKEGMVKMAPYGPGMSAQAKAACDRAQAAIAGGSLHPFAGPISDAAGTLRVPAGSVMADEDVLKMDWMVQGT